MRRRLTILLLVLAAFALPGLAHADNGGNGCPAGAGANCAIAINTTDNSSLFDFAFAIRHVLGDVVDQENGAVAYSSCESCQTTAIAIQIVLVEGTPTTVSPRNGAAAVNVDCTLCDTFASAYQFVIGTNGPVRFTEEGIRALHEIRKEIESWGTQHLSNEQIRALLPDVIARIKNILDTQLVPVGTNNGNHNDESTSTQSHEAQPNAPPGQTPTATTQTGTVNTTTTPTTSGTTTTGPATTTAPTDTTGTTTTAPTTTTTP